MVCVLIHNIIKYQILEHVKDKLPCFWFELVDGQKHNRVFKDPRVAEQMLLFVHLFS